MQCSKGSTTSTKRWRSGWESELLKGSLLYILISSVPKKNFLKDHHQARISVAIEAVAADLRHIYVLTNTGDIMTFDFGDSRYGSVSYSVYINISSPTHCLVKLRPPRKGVRQCHSQFIFIPTLVLSWLPSSVTVGMFVQCTYFSIILFWLDTSYKNILLPSST